MIVELYRLLQRSLLTVKSIECVIEQALQLASGTRDGFINAVRFIRDRDGLMAFEARFQHATLVAARGSVAVLVTEMDFDMSNALRQVTERTDDGRFDLLA